MENIIKRIKGIKYLLFLGQAISVYLLVNFAQFLFYLLKTDTVYSCRFDRGMFFLNGNQIGNEITASVGFILLLFVVLIVDAYRKNQKVNQ